MMKKSHDEFVKDQFKLFKKAVSFRNVIMLTSFIEAVIKDVAGEKKFKISLERLGLLIEKNDERISRYKDNSKYKGDRLIEINNLRVQRNDLLHDIIKKKLEKESIDKSIKSMHETIITVFTESSLIKNYFINEFGFDPSGILK